MARGRQSAGKGSAKGPKGSKMDVWEWAEYTEPRAVTQDNVNTAYRINTAPCAKGACRINCKSNPNCLNAMGERMWLGDIKDEYWHNCADPELERRGQDAFVGLKNLGATCYVNTFLQLWFHNPRLRSAVYQWMPLEPDVISNSDDKANSKTGEACGYGEQDLVKQTGKKLPPLLPSSAIESSGKSTNICSHLQIIFAQLQYSNRRYVDPMPLIQSLGLDTAQQQDAQEFSKLFMSLLESTLSKQPNPDVQEVIQRQFGGDYYYVTKCDSCGNKSKRLSRFYELDLNIQGHSSLSQCIKEFLKEEELDGDNQYFCMLCHSKQNARRYIELDRLPPVLNLQLLRFIFDRKTGYKKKLHNFIQFPDLLNLNEILKDRPEGQCAPVYELSAVLMHHGNSAYSGHYVAHIRDNKTQSWYKFNDEDIEKMQSKLKLTSDEDSLEPGVKNTKRPKCSKGYHTSRNAYMLVYTRQPTDVIQEESAEAPAHLQELVAGDNSKFEEWVTEMNGLMTNMIFEGKSQQAEIRSIYEMLPARGDEYEWVSADWLRRWLSDRHEVKPPIDNSPLLCDHGRLNPDKVQDAKRIDSKAANVFYTKYGGLPRLQRDSLCCDCVRNMCSNIRFQLKITEDDKAIKVITKIQPNPDRNGSWYWVGKCSIVSWKKLALKEREARELGEQSEVVMDSKESRHFRWGIASQLSNETTDVEGDIACRKRIRDESCREDDSEDSWSSGRKRKSNDNSKQVIRSDRGSNDDNSDDNSGGEAAAKEVNDEREEGDCSRLEDSGQEDVDDSEMFKFNEDILCEHGCLSINESCRRLVPDTTWHRLQYYFNSAMEFLETHPVCIQCQAENEDERRRLQINKIDAAEQRATLANLYHNRQRPKLDNQDLMACCLHVVANSFLDRWRLFLRFTFRCSRPEKILNASLLCPHERFMFNVTAEDAAGQLFSYVYKHEWEAMTRFYECDHVITVTREATREEGAGRLVTSPEICVDCQASRMLEMARATENYRHATIYIRKITQDHDPIQVQSSFDEDDSAPRTRQDPDFISYDRQQLSADGSARRSSRHRKQRGEIELKVHSTQTVRDIKLELMKAFSVMPMDQHLSLRGTPLTDDAAPLSLLGVRPGCLLLLKTDEPQGDAHPETYLAASSAPEKGFKGTGLVGH